jgi:hypothetical protein
MTGQASWSLVKRIRRHVVGMAKEFDLNGFAQFKTTVKDRVWNNDSRKLNLASESQLTQTKIELKNVSRVWQQISPRPMRYSG